MSQSEESLSPEIKAAIEGPKEVKPKTFDESINFNIIFRVKGKQNLFMPIDVPQKNGMIGMVEVGVNNPLLTHKDNLQCLGHFVFDKNDGTQIRMGEVFDNIEKFTLEELGKKNDIELLAIMCPDYDTDKFKTYHGEKVMKWYFEIKEKIKIGMPKQENTNQKPQVVTVAQANDQISELKNNINTK